MLPVATPKIDTDPRVSYDREKSQLDGSNDCALFVTAYYGEPEDILVPRGFGHFRTYRKAVLWLRQTGFGHHPDYHKKGSDGYRRWVYEAGPEKPALTFDGQALVLSLEVKVVWHPSPPRKVTVSDVH